MSMKYIAGNYWHRVTTETWKYEQTDAEREDKTEQNKTRNMDGTLENANTWGSSKH